MSKNSANPRAKARKRFFIETFAVFLIVISPFIFKMHQYLSVDPNATISVFGFVFDRNGFVDLNTYAWFLLGKFVPFYLLVIWFFTCKHWWYHIILIPMTMYAFQIFEVVYSEDDIVDTENIWWLLPVCMIVIPFVYFIRLKLYDKFVNGIDLEAMEAELHSLKQKQIKEKKVDVYSETPENVEYRSLSEWLNQELSTEKLAKRFKNLKHSITSMSLFKF